jgi:hypothetical protein
VLLGFAAGEHSTAMPFCSQQTSIEIIELITGHVRYLIISCFISTQSMKVNPLNGFILIVRMTNLKILSFHGTEFVFMLESESTIAAPQEI